MASPLAGVGDIHNVLADVKQFAAQVTASSPTWSERMMPALLCAALVGTAQDAGSVREESFRPRLGLSLGFGAAHGIFGPQLELILRHVSIAGGIGLVDFPFSEATNDPEGHVTPAFALRLFAGDGDGPYLSLHAAFFSADAPGVGNRLEHETRDRTVLGLTIGKRWQLGPHFFADLGIGAAVQRLHRFGRIDTGAGGLQDVDETRTQGGFIWGLATPDVDLAIGFRF
jgi:hypothetical protein